MTYSKKLYRPISDFEAFFFYKKKFSKKAVNKNKTVASPYRIRSPVKMQFPKNIYNYVTRLYTTDK